MSDDFEWAECLRRATECNDFSAWLMGMRPGVVLEQPTFPMGSKNFLASLRDPTITFWSNEHRRYGHQLAGLKYHWGVRTDFDRWMEDWI